MIVEPGSNVLLVIRMLSCIAPPSSKDPTLSVAPPSSVKEPPVPVVTKGDTPISRWAPPATRKCSDPLAGKEFDGTVLTEYTWGVPSPLKTIFLAPVPAPGVKVPADFKKSPPTVNVTALPFGPAAMTTPPLV